MAVQRTLHLLSCLLFASAALAVLTRDRVAVSDKAWAEYKSTFSKAYATASEEAYRRLVYASNMERSIFPSQANPLASFGATIFSDWTKDEFRQRLLNGNEQKIAEGLKSYHNGEMPHMRTYDARAELRGKSIPSSIDWRTRGAVTPVKNQGECGSCWSFSTIGSIEAQWFLAADQPLASFSEQNLVSCDNLIAFGCNGGFSYVAYSYLVNSQNGSVFTEASWPYVSGAGNVPPCPANKTSNHTIGGSITGGMVLAPWDAEGMKLFLAHQGPLSVAVDATTFQSYTSGILTACEGILPNHEVLVVGYSAAVVGPQNQTVPYWIIKNSWGKSWGEEGYIRLELGKNLCLVELLPNSAIVK